MPLIYVSCIYFDVAQKEAQEPNLYKSGQVRMRGPFKANWAKGEFLEPDKFCRRFSRNQHIVMTDSTDLEIYKYLSIEA